MARFLPKTPVIPGEPAVAGQNTVARDQPADWIGADGCADRPARRVRAQRAGDVAIAHRSPRWDTQKRPPDLPAPGRAVKRKRDRRFARARLEDPRGEVGRGGVIALKPGLWKAAGEIGERGVFLPGVCEGQS